MPSLEIHPLSDLRNEAARLVEKRCTHQPAAEPLLSNLGYAVRADALAERVRQSGRGARVRRFATGGIFVALGITAVAAPRS